MPALPRGTVTFLFTDIEGSTRLWQGHRDAMEAAYGWHDVLLREAVGAQGGVVYKVIGDAFQVAFPSAPQGLTAALEAQRALQGEHWTAFGLPEPLRVRMALHTGAVDPDPDGDYRSPVLNRLGRLLGAGHGGQVLLSDVVQGLTRDRLPEGVRLQDLGHHRLKDLLEPEPIHQLVHPELITDFPPLITLDSRPNNLPRQPTPFLGREGEVGQLASVLAEHQTQLVTLTGPGGTGKTRLALQAAVEVLEQFPDGVWFVDLSPLGDPAMVPSAIAEVLGVRETGGTPLTELLRDYLHEKELLLVLDNFEQVVEAASMVADLRTRCPQLTVLVTSRTRLGLRGEREYQVPPLGLPRRKPPPTLAQLGQYEAVRLFIERAQDAKSDFTVTGANAPAIAEICHRLDGLPLAIELAAARIRMLPPEAMLRRLATRLQVLTGGARDLPVRQQTLRGAIAWSHELLSPDEQALFRRLSVFAGGATYEAIEAVAAGDELGLDLFAGLERLVEHSLVRQTEAEGEPRFLMLETIREFGLEQLEGQGEAEEAHQRHATYFLALAEEAEPALRGGPEQGPWLDRMETEHDNLRAALGWTLGRDAESGLRLASALGRFWTTRGHLSEGRAWVERALAQGGDMPDPALAKALYTAGLLADYQGDFIVAQARYEEASAMARPLGDAELVAGALNGLGNMALVAGDLARAAALLEEALALHRETGDGVGIGRTSNNLGIVVAKQGDLVQATALLEECLAFEYKLHNFDGVTYAAINLGQVALAREEWEKGTGLLRDGLTTAVGLGLKAPIVAEGLASMGAVAGAVGQPEQAARLFGAADGLVESIQSFLDPVLPAEHERAASAVREALGEQAFTASWETGTALTLEEAIAEALAVDVPASDLS